MDEFNASRRPTVNGSEFKRRRLSRAQIIHLASDGCPAGNAEDIGPRSQQCGLYRRKLRVFLGLSWISAGPCGHFNGGRGLTVIADRRHRSIHPRAFGMLAVRYGFHRRCGESIAIREFRSEKWSDVLPRNVL